MISYTQRLKKLSKFSFGNIYSQAFSIYWYYDKSMCVIQQIMIKTIKSSYLDALKYK